MKKYCLILAVLLVLSSFTVIQGDYPPMDELHVGPGQTYSTIQSAVDAAFNDDTIIVHAGTYTEIVTMVNFNGLTIQGEGAETTIVDGTGLFMGSGIFNLFNCENVSISGFNITGGFDTELNGIFMYATFEGGEEGEYPPMGDGICSNNEVFNCIIHYCSEGVHIEGEPGEFGPDSIATYNTIYENDFISNKYGGVSLWEQGTDYNLIYHNNFIGNQIGGGIESDAQGEYADCGLNNDWDNGYPSGGNYYDDFDEASEGAYDDYSGPDQDILGSDGIVDFGGPGGLNPYIMFDIYGGGGPIDHDMDYYPLMEPFEWGDSQDEPDWEELHKMHFPQYPDPIGWDVSFGIWDDFEPYNLLLGDDWMCSESGNITDIHFWVSFYYDNFIPIQLIDVSIWSDNPMGPEGHSQPLEMLWEGIFLEEDFIINEPEEGDQGWIDPNPIELNYYEHNHLNYFRIDIENITTPFYQENGTIYWLVIDMPQFPELGGEDCGWKTSLDHWNDEAVFGWEEFEEEGELPPQQFYSWFNLSDPITGAPIDFAFVICGEPGEPEPEPPQDNITYYVNTSYNAGTPGWHVTHWDNIQDAVDNCTGGDVYTINVYPATYNENVVVNDDDVHIKGNYTTHRPILDGVTSNEPSILFNNAEYCSLSGLEVRCTNAPSYSSVELDVADYFEMFDCYITDCDWGLVEADSIGLEIHDNEFYDSGSYGIYIGADFSRDEQNEIYNNTCWGSGSENTAVGISIGGYISNTTVRNNYIHNCSSYGINLNLRSVDNYIYENQVENCDNDGINVGYQCARNWIYHNNFVSNPPDTHPTIFENYWNLPYPGGGNYYSGHGSQDIYKGPNQDISGSDLICDSTSPDPYTIDSPDNIDYYPFLNPFNGTLPPWNELPIIDNEDPTDSSIAINISYVNVSVDVYDEEGDSFNVSIAGQYVNDQNYNNVNNGTYTASLITPLPYYTDIIWYVNVSGVGDAGIWVNETFSFQTEIPNLNVETPTNFIAETFSDVQINLSWTTGINASKTYIRYDTDAYPTTRTEGNELCNTTAMSYNADNLIPNTQYYFSAWSWNDTYDKWSNTYVTITNTTEAPTVVYVDDDFTAGGVTSSLEFPIADGMVNWAPWPGGPPNFQYVIDDPPDDPASGVSEGMGGPELYQIAGIPMGGTITNVTLHGRFSAGSPGSDAEMLTIWDGMSGPQQSPPLTINSAFTLFEDHEWTWTNDPYTGMPWNWATLSMYQWGSEALPDLGGTVYMTQFYVEVEYDTGVTDPLFGITNFTDIDDAINAVADNGTIIVLDGTYTDTPYIVDKPCRIIGEDSDLVIIDAGGSNGFNLESPLILMKNLSIIDSLVGVYAENSQMAGIVGCYFEDNDVAINFVNFSEGAITDVIDVVEEGLYFTGPPNEFFENDAGILFENVTSVEITNNSFINHTSNAIQFIDCYENRIYQNYIENSSSSMMYAIMLDFVNNTSVEINEIYDGSGGAIYVDDATDVYLSRNIIDDVRADVINISDSQFVTIWGNNISGYLDNVNVGLTMFNSTTCEIFMNNFFDDNFTAGPALDDTGNNYWNESGIGNWWEEYDEPSEGAWDNNTDNIVDDPYLIGGGLTYDYYPVAGSFTGEPLQVYVDDDYDSGTGGWQYDHFDNIQDAVDAVMEYGHVWVANGSYNSFTIDKTINIEAMYYLQAEIDGLGGFYGIDLDSNNCYIAGLIIHNASIGIDVDLYDNNTICYNEFGYYMTIFDALYLEMGSEDNLIYANNFYYGSPTDASGLNFYDAGYPQGGNYWDSLQYYNDSYNGPNQDILGPDGIVDENFTFGPRGGPYSTDNYPLMKPWNDTINTDPIIVSGSPEGDYVDTCPTFEVEVSDAEGDSVLVEVYWSNHSLIFADVTYDTVSFSYNGILNHDQTYDWYVNISDAYSMGMITDSFTFTTCKAFDLVPDGVINYLDVSALVAHYLETVSPPGSEPWDINNDGLTNYLDISMLVANYGISY